MKSKDKVESALKHLRIRVSNAKPMINKKRKEINTKITGVDRKANNQRKGLQRKQKK